MLRPGSVLQGAYVIDQVERTGAVESGYRGHRKDDPSARVVVREVEVTPRQREGVARRYQRLQRLSHPALPAVRDLVEGDGVFYLIFDEVAGTSLESLVLRDAQRPVGRAVEWATALCDVLSYLHTQSPPFVYHTLRIDNVVIADDRLSLTEFGLCHLLDDEARATWTSYHTASTGFAAPEAYDAVPVDVTSDVYSLGAILYYVLTRMVPLGAQMRRSGVDLMPVSDLVTAINPDFDRVITRCLENDSFARFSSVRELEMALQASLPENPCDGCGRARDASSPRCKFCGTVASQRPPRKRSLDAPTTVLRSTKVVEPLAPSGEPSRPNTREASILVIESIGLEDFDAAQRAAIAQALDAIREESLRPSRREGRPVHGERLSGGSWLLAFEPGVDAIDAAVHMLGAVRSWKSVGGRVRLRGAIDLGTVTFTAEGRATGEVTGSALERVATASPHSIACAAEYLERLGDEGERLRAWMQPPQGDAVHVFPYGAPTRTTAVAASDAATERTAGASAEIVSPVDDSAATDQGVAESPPAPDVGDQFEGIGIGERSPAAAQPQSEISAEPVAPAAVMRFRVAEGAEKGRSVRLPAHDVELGRGDPSDSDASRISFAEPTMSRRQARLRYDGGYTVEHEPAATNPTLFNDLAAARHRLSVGDTVRMGHMLLIFEVDASP